MGKHENLTGAQRAARHRANLRARGLRPRQFWLPDLRDPKVRAGIDRAVAAINRSMAVSDDLAFIEAVRHIPPADPD